MTTGFDGARMSLNLSAVTNDIVQLQVDATNDLKPPNVLKASLFCAQISLRAVGGRAVALLLFGRQLSIVDVCNPNIQMNKGCSLCTHQ